MTQRIRHGIYAYALLATMALWYFYNPEIKALYSGWVKWGLLIGVWSWAGYGVWKAYGVVKDDVMQAVRMIWPQEEEDTTIIRTTLPNGDVFNGELNELLPALKRFPGKEQHGSLEYWKMKEKEFRDQKRIKLYCLNQQKYFNPLPRKQKPPKSAT